MDKFQILLDKNEVAKQIAASEASIMALLIAGVFYYIFNVIVAFVMEYIEEKLDYYD